MNRVYIHSKNNTKKYFTKLYIILGLFFLYGFYLNSILSYKNGYISLFTFFKPIILLLGSIIISVISNKIFSSNHNEHRLLINIIISLTVPAKVNLIVYFVLLILLNILYKYFHFNSIALFMCILGIISYFMHNFTFNNNLSLFPTKYGFGDYLLGKGPGGISSSLIILSIISLIILICDINYKKELPIWTIITYFILQILSSFALQNASFDLFLNSNFYFATILVAPIAIYSPYTRGGSIISGILLGILAFASSFFSLNWGIYLAIIIVSICKTFIDRFITSKNNDHLIDVL